MTGLLKAALFSMWLLILPLSAFPSDAGKCQEFMLSTLREFGPPDASETSQQSLNGNNIYDTSWLYLDKRINFHWKTDQDGCKINKNYFEWQFVQKKLQGLIFTIMIMGSFAGIMVKLIKRSIPLVSPSPANKEISEKWEELGKDSKGMRDRNDIESKVSAGAVLGSLEQFVFFVAIWTSRYEIIAGWLAFKVASKWETWSTISSLPTQLPDSKTNMQSLDYIVAKNRLGSNKLMSFLVGTLWNIIAAFLGVLCASLFVSMPARLSEFILLLGIFLLIAVLIYKSLKKAGIFNRVPSNRPPLFESNDWLFIGCGLIAIASLRFISY